MILTPGGIRKQEFNKSFRGFDKEEVQAFLEKLSAEVEALFNENETINKELEETKQRLENFVQIENKMRQTIAEGELKSNQLLDEAQNKAGVILRLAEEKSIDILQKSRDEADNLKSAIINLREEKEILIAKLKTIINYQSHILETKVEDAGEVIKETKKPEHNSGIQIDVKDIVQKLL